ARTTSSVSGFGNASLISIPSSPSAITAFGLTSSPGAEPAERTLIRPCERSFNRPAAIWLRPELWTQTNSTSGCVLRISGMGPASQAYRRRSMPLTRDDDEAIDLCQYLSHADDRHHCRFLPPAAPRAARSRGSGTAQRGPEGDRRPGPASA